MKKPELCSISLLILLVSLISSVTGHASITFPPGRLLDLDFLDNARTKPPCGMPKGKYRTSLLAGSTVNVTWHLAYPHQGGFRIELLDKNEKFMTKLSDPGSSETHVRGNPTAQSHTIKIPEEPCEDCTIRLLREASEWQNYFYWSCSDISIVKAPDYKEDCLGRGKPSENGECTCDKGYWGQRCQYKDECETDSDCGNGECVEIGGTNLPRKECFCSAGFHGELCEFPNKDTLATPENLELSKHNKKILSDRIQLYHKIVSDASVPKADKEIEFVLVVNGTSYIGVGWRPESIDESCKSLPAVEGNALSRRKRAPRSRPFKPNPTLLEPLHAPERIRIQSAESSMNSKRSPKQNPKATTKPPPKPSPEPEPEAEAESKPHPEPSSEPIPEQEASAQAESEPESEPKPESEPEGKPKPESESEPSAEPESAPESEPTPEETKETTSKLSETPKSKREPKPEPTPEAEPTAEAEPKPESEPESIPSAEPSLSEPSSEPATEPETSSGAEPETAADESAAAVVIVEPEPEPNSGKPVLEDVSPYKLERKYTQYTPKKGEFHYMDCSDIVIGTARGMNSRVRDYYTRDRSTPRLDMYYGGTDDITSATGWEKDGVTTIIFRRKVQSSDPTDHPITGNMQVIWARGQEHGQYAHIPKSGLEVENPSVPNFYAQDELKYHGKLTQRGLLFINFP